MMPQRQPETPKQIPRLFRISALMYPDLYLIILKVQRSSSAFPTRFPPPPHRSRAPELDAINS